MNPGMMAGGAGLGLLGAGLSAYGQSEGAKGMAKVQKRRLADLSNLDNQALDKMQAHVNQQNIGAQLQGGGASNAAAQAELAKLAGAGQSAGVQVNPQDLNAVSSQMANQSQLSALGRVQDRSAADLENVQNEQSALQQLAARRNAIYDMQQQVAANRGAGYRLGGALAGLGGSGLFTLGSLAQNTPGIYSLSPMAQTPMGGWASQQPGLA